jgi:hypothetical protein
MRQQSKVIKMGAEHVPRGRYCSGADGGRVLSYQRSDLGGVPHGM